MLRLRSNEEQLTDLWASNCDLHLQLGRRDLNQGQGVVLIVGLRDPETQFLQLFLESEAARPIQSRKWRQDIVYAGVNCDATV